MFIEVCVSLSRGLFWCFRPAGCVWRRAYIRNAGRECVWRGCYKNQLHQIKEVHTFFFFFFLQVIFVFWPNIHVFMSDYIFAVGSICQGEVHYTSSRSTQSQQERVQTSAKSDKLLWRKVSLQSFKSAPQRWWYGGGTMSGGSVFLFFLCSFFFISTQTVLKSVGFGKGCGQWSAALKVGGRGKRQRPVQV